MGQKYLSGDQIQGLDVVTDVSYPLPDEPDLAIFLTILTLVLARNSKISKWVFVFLHFAGLKGLYTSQ